MLTSSWQPTRRLLVFLVAIISFAAAPTASGQVLREEWQLTLLESSKIGYEHTTVEQTESGGIAAYKTITRAHLVIERLGQGIELESSGWVLEDGQGRILSMHSETKMSSAVTSQDLVVRGDKAEVTTTTVGRPSSREIPWKQSYLGPNAREQDLHRRIRAGEKQFQYEDFMLELGPTTVAVEILGKAVAEFPDGTRETLLRVKSTLPTTVVDEYLDADFNVKLTRARQMGMSFVTLPATRAECLAALKNPDSVDVLAEFSPRCNVRLPEPYSLDETVYQIRAKDPDFGFPELDDERQRVTRKISDMEQELTIVRRVPEKSVSLPLESPTAEELTCLKANAFVQSDDPRLAALARTAVGNEKDAWRAAQRLEKFVYKYIGKKDMGTGFASALEILDRPEGDCTEHGVFLTAMCRAAGIPSRVAVGLVYFEGIWGGHMWTEVSVGGEWFALDATMGNGGVGSTHIRFGADTLETGQLESAFANMASGVGNLEIDVISFRRGDRTVQVGSDFVVHEIKGNRYRHLLNDFAVSAPPGFEFKPGENKGLESSTMVEIRNPNKLTDTLMIRVGVVPLAFSLKEYEEQIGQAGLMEMQAESVRIDGRRARILTGTNRADDHQAKVILLRGTTLFTIQMLHDEPGDDELLKAVLASIDLDPEAETGPR